MIKSGLINTHLKSTSSEYPWPLSGMYGPGIGGKHASYIQVYHSLLQTENSLLIFSDKLN